MLVMVWILKRHVKIQKQYVKQFSVQISKLAKVIVNHWVLFARMVGMTSLVPALRTKVVLVGVMAFNSGANGVMVMALVIMI